jgi:hypothetical protein
MALPGREREMRQLRIREGDMTDCPTCGQRVPEPRPLLDATPNDHRVGRIVRAVLNELVGCEVTCERVVELVAARLEEKLGYCAGVARGMSTRAVAYVLD